MKKSTDEVPFSCDDKYNEMLKPGLDAECRRVRPLGLALQVYGSVGCARQSVSELKRTYPIWKGRQSPSL